jgi:hypothetical protein
MTWTDSLYVCCFVHSSFRASFTPCLASKGYTGKPLKCNARLSKRHAKSRNGKSRCSGVGFAPGRCNGPWTLNMPIPQPPLELSRMLMQTVRTSLRYSQSIPDHLRTTGRACILVQIVIMVHQHWQRLSWLSISLKTRLRHSAASI